MPKQKIIAVVGPTASGKTALGVYLARHLCGEVISCDSMQIYKYMDIATAKPTAEEMQGIRHHLIDFLPPECSYSVAAFCRDAALAAADIVSRGKIPIIVGGTGLYVDSFLNNTEFLEDAHNDGIRQQLFSLADEKGTEFLYEKLLKSDPQAASKIHPNNTVKIVRALEVLETTGMTITRQAEISHKNPSPYDAVYIGINYKDRQKLYDRINKRVDIMLENGLVDEARRFYEHSSSDTSVNVIGYKELKPFLDGVLPLDVCVENLKRATRHYAKRQLTWFGRNEKTLWFYADDYSVQDDLYADVLSAVTKGGEEI